MVLTKLYTHSLPRLERLHKIKYLGVVLFNEILNVKYERVYYYQSVGIDGNLKNYLYYYIRIGNTTQKFRYQIIDEDLIKEVTKHEAI